MASKKLFARFLLLFALLACTTTAKNKNSLLWEISGNGLSAPSYLFGTHHLISLSFLDKIKGLNEALESTEQVVGELDLREMNSIQMKIMQNAWMSADTTYSRLMSEEDLRLLDSLLVSFSGFGLNRLGTMKPAMLSNLITVSLYKKYYPNESEQSMDEYFQKRAAELSHSILGLETAEDQIFVLLNSQTIERQSEMLSCIINHPELLKENMDKLQAAYINQDLQKLYRLLEEETPDDPCPSTRQEKDIINKSRNAKWLEVLPGILSEKPSFIAIGCMHLVGESGIIEGLRRLGYKVEPVS